MPTQHQLAPPRRLPILYLGFAHLSLLVAASVAAFDPVSITGFYYHPRMIGVVHLVTLGWITGSIIGALFIVGPLALRTPIPVRRIDYWAYGFFTIGVVGMVSHFWIEQYSGMAWSAGMVLAAFVQIVVRVARPLVSAPLPRAIPLHVILAMANLIGAATIGVLVGIDRDVDVMPGTTLPNVYTHAHLAGVGWATLMVLGVGYRMLPMVLPSAMPTGPRLTASALLVEVGVIGLAASLFFGRTPLPFALLVCNGLALFLINVRWMFQHRRPPPTELPRPDWGGRQAVQALAYLGCTATLGLYLASAPTTVWSARLAMLYGVLGLLGFLAQIVVGIEHRLLPLFQWHTTVQKDGWSNETPSPHAMGSQAYRSGIYWLWTVAVPLLAVGLSVEQASLVRVGGLCLLSAAALQTHQARLILRSRTHSHVGAPATQVAR